MVISDLKTPSSLTVSTNNHHHYESNEKLHDGWEDESDDQWDFEDDELDESRHSASTTEPPFDDQSPPLSPPPVVASSVTPNNTRAGRLYVSLCEYMDWLHSPRLVPAIHACFDERIHTPAATSELVRYYQSRPRLEQYTLETELPRMQYTVYPADGGPPLTGVKEIQEKYLNDQHHHLLWRAANQSLLADAIATLTYGLRPPLFRPDYLITSVATRCHFTLVLAHPQQSAEDDHLTCTCELLLQFPDLVLATLSLHVFFCPARCALECRVTDLVVAPTHVVTHEKLHAMAAEIARDTVDDGDHDQYEHQQAPPVLLSFRDSLVSQGLRSALDQVDTVVNVQSKWRFLQSVLPALPSAELLQEAERETQLLATEEGSQWRECERDETGATNGGTRSYNEEPRSELQLYRKEEEKVEANGKGGIRLYNNYVKEPQITLYQKEQVVPTPPPNTQNDDAIRLYRKEDIAPHPTTTPPPTIPDEASKMEPRRHVLLPAYYEQPDQISEGWSDDLDDDDLDDDNSDTPSWTKPEEDLCLDVDYAIKVDHQVGLVQTRKRWIRPVVSLGRIRF